MKHPSILATLACLSFSAMPVCAEPPPLTIVHLTDIHMRPDFDAPKRLPHALADVRKRNPALIINTGDTIDGSSRSEEKWRLWRDAVAAEISGIPLYNLLGNHDIDRPLTKEASCRELGMPARFYTFDKLGWRFVMLDGNGLAKDQEQWNWLVKLLDGTPTSTPVAIATHQPVFSMGAAIHTPGDMSAKWRELIALFAKHPNVKLCMGGHIHLADVCRYNGVTYTCGGSLGGYWWETVKSSDGKGSYHETPPGYNIIKLSSSDVISVTYTRYPDPVIDNRPESPSPTN